MRPLPNNSIKMKTPYLQPINKFLQIFFILSKDRNRVQTTIFYSFYILMVLMDINQFVYVFIVRDVRVFLKFSQFIILHISPVNILGFVLNESKWLEIVQKITAVEDELMQDKLCAPLMEKYGKRNRILTLAFWGLCAFLGVLLSGEIWFSFVTDTTIRDDINDEILFNFWWPFEHNRVVAYIIMALKNLYMVGMSIYVLSCHSTLISLMIWFSGQLVVVRVRMNHALDTKDEKKQKANLIQCHRHYLRILEIHRDCNSLMSPVMFINILLIGGNIAVMPIFSKVDLAGTLQTSISVLIMLFVEHHYGSDVLYQSEQVSSGLFESAWPGTNRSIRKDLLLLCGATRRRLVFTASPLLELTLPTFASMLRFSYSVYTIMSRTDKI